MATKKKPTKPCYVWEMNLSVSITYRKNEVHDQSFYLTFRDIFHAARKQFPEYEIELLDAKITKHPKFENKPDPKDVKFRNDLKKFLDSPVGKPYRKRFAVLIDKKKSARAPSKRTAR